jgi:hypothetical protein
MANKQLGTVTQFANKLIDLGVLLQKPLEPLQNNFPLFLVEKLVRGEWRCIAAGKSGGQNDVCSLDPVHLGTPDNILPYLYTCGVLAIIDISKFFHMFPTVSSERKYIPPLTGEHYCYATCPMGTQNSPGASGQFGNAFMRMLVGGCALFQGTPQRNGFLSHLAGEPFDPGLGTGRVEITANGKAACRSWIHVDDILLHGTSRENFGKALDHTMNLALELGLVCQPSKTSPPAPIKKFCGFIYDTSGIPERKVPANKVSRLALLSFIRWEVNGPLACLGLSVHYRQ